MKTRQNKILQQFDIEIICKKSKLLTFKNSKKSQQMNVSSGNRERRVTIREIHRQVQLLSMYVVVHTVHSRPKIQKKSEIYAFSILL